jgi:hypothetical protein
MKILRPSAKNWSKKSDATGEIPVCSLLLSLISVSFGAVLEEFEVRDALESVFYGKPEMTL